MSQKWSAEIVVSAIQNLQQEGQPLNSNHAQTQQSPLYNAACVYWGSWRKAIEAAGISYDTVRVKKPNRKVVWSKEIIRQNIKNLFNQGEPLNSHHVQRNHHPLYGAACKYFGGWPQAIAEAGIEYSTVRLKELRTWSKAAIAQAILARVTSGLPLNGETVSNEDRGLYNAARRHFGSKGWAKARMFAGLSPTDPDPRKIWDTRSVKVEILRLHANGVSLNTGALQGGPYEYIRAAGCKVFGSWSKAINATGLNYEEIRKGRRDFWTREEILQSIKSLEGQGIRLSSKDIHHSHGGLFSAAVVQFGCWSQAVEMAGISYQKHCRVWSTKAWLRRMKPEEYQAVLSSSQQYAKTRKGI